MLLKRERSEPSTGRPLSPVELPTPPGSPPPSQTNTPSDWGLGQLYPLPKEEDTEMTEVEEEKSSEEVSPLECMQSSHSMDIAYPPIPGDWTDT